MVEKKQELIVSIHQPSYWPWFGLLYKIAVSDSFVILDDVATNKATNQYRNIFFCNGKEKYLTLPINYKMGIKLIDLEFKNDLYIDDHVSKLENYYRKAPFYSEGISIVKKIFLKNHVKPIDLIIDTMMSLMETFLIKTKLSRSSDLKKVGAKDDLVLEICRALSADTYISGMGGLNYMKNYDKFDESGINIRFIKYTPIIYKQSPEFRFVPGLSAIDLIMFNGVEQSQKIFRENFSKIELLEKEQVL